ncbi:nosiheptide resistance regulatory protein [Streptomyces caelestis]|uniref:Nosiheptide resistance regulatory protein n=1 Tax=Streptomyces caelestis TaxID=36816 RepID=A0A0M8QLJ2_9ACTN|nr:nosiheptide resistance regulatory protein [Streptomyces caelestis]KOV29347.1 nosiheptide resistance regulatory protein [Streptomyces sp. XY152]
MHAAEVVAPYADTAKVRAAHYAQEARVRLAPVVTQAAGQARVQYGAHVQPYLEQARTHVPPKVDQAAHQAADRTRKAARQAAEYSRPRIEQVVAVAGPAKDEAAARGAAALVALRGQVSAQQIQKLVRKQRRRAKAGRAAKTVLILGAVAGGAVAAWKWWDKQANPDWLVEPPAATDVSSGSTKLTSVDGSGGATLDPAVEAKEAEEEAARRDDQA